jgi:hypothetical protein
MTAAAVNAPRSLAIISPVQDFLFFFLSAAVVLVVWFASSVLHVDGFTILAAVAVTSNGPHLVSTWTRVYFDPREWKARPVSLVLVPSLVTVAVFTITVKLEPFGQRLLNSVILYWATWHFVAQNWGILRIYQRKSGEPLTSFAMRLERPLLLLIVLFSLAHRIATGPRILFGVEVLYPPLSREWALTLLVPIGVLTGLLLASRIRERNAPWAKAAWVRLAFIGCSFLGFFVPFQLITSDDTSGFAAAASWHGFQYLGMVRHYHRNTWRAGVDPQARVISWLSQPGWARASLYFAMLLALAGAVYGVVFALSLVTPWNFYTWAGIVWVSLTLSHYWMDGVIWKLRRPEVARRVGIDVAGAPA